MPWQLFVQTLKPWGGQGMMPQVYALVWTRLNSFALFRRFKSVSPLRFTVLGEKLTCYNYKSYKWHLWQPSTNFTMFTRHLSQGWASMSQPDSCSGSSRRTLPGLHLISVKSCCIMLKCWIMIHSCYMLEDTSCNLYLYGWRHKVSPWLGMTRVHYERR